MNLTQIGFLMNVLGGFLVIAVDIPPLTWWLSPSLIEDCRRQLFDRTSVTNEQEKYKILLSIVRNYWDEELDTEPWLFLMEKPGPNPRGLLAVYDKDSQGPFGDQMEMVRSGEDPPSIDPDEVMNSEKWDWICPKQRLDRWFNQEIDRKRKIVRTLKILGAIVFMAGAVLQAGTYFPSLLQSLMLGLIL